MINSTHAYEKLDTTLTKAEIQELCEYADKPVEQFLLSLGIEQHLRDILYFAIGCFEEREAG